MKVTRAQFKRALRSCQTNNCKASADLLAKNLLNKDDKAFWKEINRINNSHVPLAETISGVSGKEPISKMWKEHFSSLLNSSKDDSNKCFVDSILNNKSKLHCDRFSPSEVIDALKGLKNGKSPGLDGVYSEHFKYSHDKISILLSLLFNTMVMHGYIPSNAMDTIIVPIIKDKKGDCTDKDNYRPVAITCVVSKILELVILKRCESALSTTENQFGFKPGLGTDTCIFALKQVIQYYQSLSSPVYVAFIDASKAFDKINHYHLMAKLINCEVPVIIVRLLYFWHRMQCFVVRWGDCISSRFTVCNGVRQGGIASPIFFNVFLNQLSMELNDSKIGCSVNAHVINHLFYADDSVVLAPSPKALQLLINICENYAKRFELTFNVRKTKVMCFKPKNRSDLHVPQFTLNGSIVEVVSLYKYLGVFLADDLVDDRDIQRQVKAIYARGNMLTKKFRMCSNEVKARLFKSYCSSMYCSALWSAYTVGNFRKLQTSYNKMIRIFFNLERECSISAKCIELNVDCFKVLQRKHTFSLRSRILVCDSSIVKCITSSVFFISSSINNRWNDTLFTFHL